MMSFEVARPSVRAPSPASRLAVARPSARAMARRVRLVTGSSYEAGTGPDIGSRSYSRVRPWSYPGRKSPDPGETIRPGTRRRLKPMTRFLRPGVLAALAILTLAGCSGHVSASASPSPTVLSNDQIL